VQLDAIPPAASPFDVTTAQPSAANTRGQQGNAQASAFAPPPAQQQPQSRMTPPPQQAPQTGPRLTESLLGFKAVQPPQPGPSGQQQVPQRAMTASGYPAARPSERPASMPPPAAPLLLDVTPHSLSVETVGGLCEVVIPRNATIPVEQSRQFATAYDGQDGVRIRISQGESRRFNENQALGELELSGITRASRGEVTIAVTFELDADGTLNVRAKEVATGRQTQTRVVLLTMPSAAATAGMAQRQRDRA
jgi:molecular chaperone DnaK